METKTIVAILVLLVIAYCLFMREQFAYPPLIPNNPPYIPLGGQLGMNWSQGPKPTYYPPHLANGVYSLPGDVYIVGQPNVQPAF